MKFERLIISLSITALSLLPFLEAVAEVIEVRLSVDGLSCPFCVYGLEKKLKNINGVKDLQIDLKSGSAVITLEEGLVPDTSTFENAVKKAGFTLGGMKITAVGSIVFKENRAFLKLRNSDQEYLLLVVGTVTSSDRLQEFIEKGTVVVITGSIQEEANETTGLTAEKVKEFATNSQWIM